MKMFIKYKSKKSIQLRDLYVGDVFRKSDDTYLVTDGEPPYNDDGYKMVVSLANGRYFDMSIDCQVIPVSSATLHCE
jgi:hypothetical protein